jgi:hypothetical protein
MRRVDRGQDVARRLMGGIGAHGGATTSSTYSPAMNTEL